MSAPLVLIHGFAGGPWSWDPVVAALPSSAEVVRVTLPGHRVPDNAGVAGEGRAGSSSERDEAGVSFERTIDHIAEELRGYGVRCAHLCGYSLGARVGLGLLVRHPELFRRATLIGVNPGLRGEAARDARVASDQQWIDMLETRGLPAFLDAWEAQALFASQARVPEATKAWFRERRLRLDPGGLAHSLRTLGLGVMPDHHPFLAEIQVPVQLVCGTSDHRFLGFAVQMAGRLPRPSLRIVPDAGHNVVLEQPRAVAALLMEGLAHEQPGRVEARSGL